jgi:hypothetical protein
MITRVASISQIGQTRHRLPGMATTTLAGSNWVGCSIAICFSVHAVVVYLLALVLQWSQVKLLKVCLSQPPCEWAVMPPDSGADPPHLVTAGIDCYDSKATSATHAQQRLDHQAECGFCCCRRTRHRQAHPCSVSRHWALQQGQAQKLFRGEPSTDPHRPATTPQAASFREAQRAATPNASLRLHERGRSVRHVQ